MSRHRRQQRKRARRARERALYYDAPYVCPGCYAVGDEPCAPGCIDAEIARSGYEDDAYFDGGVCGDCGAHSDEACEWDCGSRCQPDNPFAVPT